VPKTLFFRTGQVETPCHTGRRVFIRAQGCGASVSWPPHEYVLLASLTSVDLAPAGNARDRTQALRAMPDPIRNNGKHEIIEITFALKVEPAPVDRQYHKPRL
jgi:hypothetical protein